MLIHNLKDESELVKLETGDTLVDFYADWCGPCKSLSANLEKLSKCAAEDGLSNINVVKVNIENFQEVAQKYNVRALPTLVFVKDNQVLKTKVGATPYNTLVDLVKEVYNVTK